MDAGGRSKRRHPPGADIVLGAGLLMLLGDDYFAAGNIRDGEVAVVATLSLIDAGLYCRVSVEGQLTSGSTAMWAWIKRCLSGEEGKRATEEAPLRYQGYDIVAAPVTQNGQYRICGVIRQLAEEGDGELAFDRADTFADREMAVRMMQLKARQFIDQQTGPLF